MKSTFLLTLMLCLVASMLPVRAEQRVGTPASSDGRGPITQGPIARTITHEAARLAAEGPQVAKQRGPNFARTWSSVGKGAAIGFGIGAALGMTVGQEACLNEPRWHCAKVGMPVAVVGAVIAWLLP